MPVIFAVLSILAAGVGFFLYYFLRGRMITGKTSAAASYLDKNKNLQAIRAGKAAIEKDPRNTEAHYLLGKAFLRDNREEQALREFKSVNRLGIEGKNIPETEFRQTIAGLYQKFNENEEALKEYLLLIKIQPENAEYHFQAGQIFAGRSRADLAEGYFSKAISFNSKEPKYFTELGVLLYHERKLKEADSAFRSVLKIEPNNPKANLYMGKIHKDTKDYAASLPYFEKACRDQDYKIRALVETGSCYMSLKMVDKAITELERAVAAGGSDAETDSLYARYFLALCYEKKKLYQQAVAQWEKIYAQKKNFRDVGEKLMRYQEYRQSGQT
ncbi:MAG: tetratricopeptide repeat protein [Treponema sp.]|nr:tetratricopeptide repeat protein [Treponema sp.]